VVGVLRGGMTNQDLVLKDIERCKKVAPILERLGIEPDEKLPSFCVYDGSTPLDDFYIPTYRQDKLALALPEWFFDRYFDRYYEDIHSYLINCTGLKNPNYTLELFNTAMINRGQEQLNATADLIISLNTEGLL